MSAGPLAGRGILITRPAEQSEGLAAVVEAQGGNAILFPALAIAPPENTRALAHAIGNLRDYDLIIFISPTSVERVWPFILERHGDWPHGFALAAVGQGTARALASYGAGTVLVSAAGADSESLLDLPALCELAGKHILIVRGEGGREMLADTLRQRGATVAYAEAYRRVKPLADARPLLALWRRNAIQAVTVTSREIVANLFELLGQEGAELLRATPLFAMHERIAAAARDRGVTTVIVTPPGDAGLVAGLLDWYSVRHD
ncbi:MAG: uroporphyrinogen III synthase [Hydrogenophilales bacterium CG15_BIG_FIL_POST_REV_8_21_14_020_62_31]|nr:uroporphyrinogen-III synthase [Betaproteobacteria bacterium]PIW39549.1 MAG: uroporphyrinogen III synthase [Hydrogenophilales bacterium CG15_BIG_FIL_POST_REV_8_21_14_020_62_31]PIY98700.1 MAG: uroporphyrinogen III synthase [Hydrogenophilales bacterium CG_4_10_14_0_8_um_filter_62_70]